MIEDAVLRRAIDKVDNVGVISEEMTQSLGSAGGRRSIGQQTPFLLVHVSRRWPRKL